MISVLAYKQSFRNIFFVKSLGILLNHDQKINYHGKRYTSQHIHRHCHCEERTSARVQPQTTTTITAVGRENLAIHTTAPIEQVPNFYAGYRV